MTLAQLDDCLSCCPVIAAVHEEGFFEALKSPCDVIFMLGSNVLTVKERINAAHKEGKWVFIHIDLADGIGKDKAGIEFLSLCGADGIISTRAHLIRAAKENGLITVQRFFALDSQGIESISDMLETASPHLMEIMPGVIGKIIERFAGGKIPLIAGGLIETKADVTTALSLGAMAVSTGKKELWYI